MRTNLRTVLLFRDDDVAVNQLCIDHATIADTAEGQVRTWLHALWWPHVDDYLVAREHWGL